MTLDAIHSVYCNKKASEEAIKSFRKFYPKSIYVLIGDGGADYSDLSEKYNCFYLHYDWNLGYPNPVCGHGKAETIEYLMRINTALLKCRSPHIITMEDDVKIINKVEFDPNDEMLVTPNCSVNILPNALLKYMQSKSCNCIMPDNFYGLGGGSIFKRSSFLESHDSFMLFIDANFHALQNLFPHVGWTDCAMSLVFMHNGINHKFSRHIYELKPHEFYDYVKVERQLSSQYAVLHHYKKHYHRTLGWQFLRYLTRIFRAIVNS